MKELFRIYKAASSIYYKNFLNEEIIRRNLSLKKLDIENESVSNKNHERMLVGYVYHVYGQEQSFIVNLASRSLYFKKPNKFVFNLTEIYWFDDTPDLSYLRLLKGKLIVPGNPKYYLESLSVGLWETAHTYHKSTKHSLSVLITDKKDDLNLERVMEENFLIGILIRKIRSLEYLI